MATDAPDRVPSARRVARNTAFFSFATGLSRLLGLIREVVAAKYFGETIGVPIVLLLTGVLLIVVMVYLLRRGDGPSQTPRASSRHDAVL